MILEQIGTTITLNAPLVSVNNGDQLVIFAGCDHSVTTCKSKYDNVINFGGLPDLNASINPWAPKGLGIIQQS